MKPIAIFRHLPHEGAGYFDQLLTQRGLPSQLICVDAGDAIPHDATRYAGLVFMGGNMSVNDDLPWIPQSLALIQQAVTLDIPVLGHCLGGQLIAKAMGAHISTNPVKEIGWGDVTVNATANSHEWLGTTQHFTAFHWHGETFDLPQDAENILSSQYCPHQAFILHNTHLAMQCHVEMTAHMVEEWCKQGGNEIATASHSPAVQTCAAIQTDMHHKLNTLHSIADRLYTRWLGGIAHT